MSKRPKPPAKPGAKKRKRSRRKWEREKGNAMKCVVLFEQPVSHENV